MNIRAYLSVLFDGIKFIRKNLKIISGGQSSNFAVIQQAHKLEKGLSIREPRRLWGYDNARKLVDFISDEMTKNPRDIVALNIGLGVLKAYVSNKMKLGDPEEQNRVGSLLSYIYGKGVRLPEEECSIYGGTLPIKRSDILVNYNEVSLLFLTRHSVRDFEDTPIENEKLERAINLALRAPSACNRQPTKIYVISGKDRENIGSDNSYHADKYLILTGQMKAFSIPELNDWIVSTSVFAGYLSLALHAVGIGSCIFRKDIVRQSKYNELLKSFCKIPNDEQIILEMAVGNYKEEFNVPVSYRRKASDITRFI